MSNTSDSANDRQNALDARALESLRLIYAETSATMRHYSSLQFAIQTLYLASVGALGSAAFISEKANVLLGAKPVAAWAAGAGILISVFFFLLTLACERHRKHFGEKARELERAISPCVVLDVPPSRAVGATNALNGFYIICIVFWCFGTLVRGL